MLKKKHLKKAAAFSLVLAQLVTCSALLPLGASAFAGKAVTRNMENLDRGVVAVKTDGGVFISWRRLGTEPANTQFTLYRNKEKVTEGAITNFVDPAGKQGDAYTVVANGKMSKSVDVLPNQYFDIPLGETPESDVLLTDRNGVYYGGYTPGDSTYGDLDGDGQYEIIMMWCPADAKDAATGGRTGKVYVDAYKLDGTQLWRIDMGYNIRAGAHDTQYCVADFDGDGKAEVILRTADGTVDGQGNVIGDASKGDTYENSWAYANGGKNLTGPLYVTCFDGETGKALDTIDYFPQNSIGSMATSLSFGDDFGNRSERYNGTIAYLDGQNPSAVFARGYYFGKGISTPNGRTACAAYDFKNGKLSLRWSFDTANSGYEQYIGQGNHQMEAGDVDGDGKDEILYGALTWDDDGSVLWCTFQEHGDAMHLGDFDPTREGLEFLKVYEDYSDDSDIFSFSNPEFAKFEPDKAMGAENSNGRHIWGVSLQDAKTGKFIQIHNGIKDTGRGVIANIGYGESYYVMWAAGSSGYWDSNGNKLNDLGLAMNGRIYWDGDLQDELQDHVTITKWNDTAKKVDKVYTIPEAKSINGTKGNVNIQTDLIGDWREELVGYVVLDEKIEEIPMEIEGSFGQKVQVTATRPTYKYALRVATTTIPTKYNFYTLNHDDIYRNSSASYANCYNQPPHISWYMNDKIANSPYTTQPDANVKLVSNNYKPADFSEAALPEKGNVIAGNVTPGNSGGATEPTKPSATTAPVVIEGECPFGDIQGHWAENDIKAMYQAGIINGMTENKFVPEGEVTRGQFIKLVVSALRIPVGTAATTGHWALPYITAANDANLINSNIPVTTEADLDSPISREEMATMVAAAAEYSKVSIPVGVKNFADVNDISSWASNGVQKAAILGIVSGFDDNTFRPHDGATRAQSAKMLSRLCGLIK